MLIDMTEHINTLFMTFVIGAASLGVRQIQKMSNNIANMTLAVQVLSEKLVGVDKIAQDHEHRIRSIENSRRKPR